MKVLFKEINLAQARLMQLENILKLILSLRLPKKKKNYNDMEMNLMEN
jgi:hypothetical protein